MNKAQFTNSLIFIFAMIISGGYAHDINMAVFEISSKKDNSSLMLSITLDREDFLRTLFASTGSRLSTNERLKWAAQHYFESNLMIRVNGSCTSFRITDAEFLGEYIKLKGVFERTYDAINEVQVENYCMLNVVKDQENIVRLHLNDQQRSFRLNEDRIRTVASYNSSP